MEKAAEWQVSSAKEDTRSTTKFLQTKCPGVPGTKAAECENSVTQALHFSLKGDNPHLRREFDCLGRFWRWVRRPSFAKPKAPSKIVSGLGMQEWGEAQCLAD